MGILKHFAFYIVWVAGFSISGFFEYSMPSRNFGLILNFERSEPNLAIIYR
jgi:hypothetical protein